jgi:hypothetical protein
MKITAVLLSLLVSTTSFAYEITEKNVRNPNQKEIHAPLPTPKQPAPNEQWHVHDPKRTQPAVVEPKYDGKPVVAPADATIIFDGKSLDKLTNKKWKLEDGVMTVARGSQKSVDKFKDLHLHVEWRAPLGRKGWGQAQGNSGVFFPGGYEVQVLNCWANRTYPDGMTGAIYGQQPPMFNACRKPGEWQAYDIHYKAPVFKDDKLVTPPYITVFLNGIKIHDNYEIKGTCHYRKVASFRPHNPEGQISLQAHGNPVSYRNIWAAPLKMKLGK